MPQKTAGIRIRGSEIEILRIANCEKSTYQGDSASGHLSSKHERVIAVWNEKGEGHDDHLRVRRGVDPVWAKKWWLVWVRPWCATHTPDRRCQGQLLQAVIRCARCENGDRDQDR
jgi:hypothetical protein